MLAITKPDTLPDTSARHAAIWVAILALAQLADVLTTQAALVRGGAEANGIAAGIIGLGGLGLLGVVKLLLVLAMGGAVMLLRRYDDDGRARAAATVVLRGTQLCAAVLAVTALQNLDVIRHLSA